MRGFIRFYWFSISCISGKLPVFSGFFWKRKCDQKWCYIYQISRKYSIEGCPARDGSPRNSAGQSQGMPLHFPIFFREHGSKLVEDIKLADL